MKVAKLVEWLHAQLDWDQDAHRVVAYAPERLKVTHPRGAEPGLADINALVAGASVRRRAGECRP